MMGAQKGAHETGVINYSLYFIVLSRGLSPAFAPFDMQIKSLMSGFFLCLEFGKGNYRFDADQALNTCV